MRSGAGRAGFVYQSETLINKIVDSCCIKLKYNNDAYKKVIYFVMMITTARHKNIMKTLFMTSSYQRLGDSFQKDEEGHLVKKWLGPYRLNREVF
jgi:hypothetical protein